jgi:hypothetical protein
MTSFKPRAYAHGELINLCGVFAVVNAVRQTVGPVRSFHGKDCRWLFGELVAYLGKTESLTRAVTKGLKRPHISKLLQVSEKALANRFGVSLSHENPFRDNSNIRLSKIINVVKSHQRLPATAVLIGFSGHWSVVQSVSTTGFRLLDSAGVGRLAFNDVIIGIPKDPNETHWILPSWVYLLKYSVKR